jgi:hypothetical protein
MMPPVVAGMMWLVIPEGGDGDRLQKELRQAAQKTSRRAILCA